MDGVETEVGSYPARRDVFVLMSESQMSLARDNLEENGRPRAVREVRIDEQ